MYDTDEYFLDEVPVKDVDWNDEFSDMAETLRDSLEDDYGATTEQMQEALLDVFDSLSPAESFNLAKALSQIEKGASSAIRDPTVGQLARTALPLAGGAGGTLVGGPLGTAVGSRVGQVAVQALPASGPPRRIGATVPPAPGVANGSAAALRGLVLTQKPEVLKSLLAVALGQHGRTKVDGVPVGAVLSLLSSVFGQAAADADELLYRRDGEWADSLDAEADFEEDLISPADRGLALYADLVDIESEELAEVVGW